MIMKLRNILTVLAIMTAATACFKLDKDPEGVLSTNNPFRSTGEIQNYINQFYETAVRTQDFGMGGGNHIAGSDTYSDNMAASAPVARINGALSIGNAVSLSAYTRIRNVNFLLNNKDNCDKTGNYNQLIGEAYYFRAWYYYQLLKDYGGVAIVKEPLNPEQRRHDARPPRCRPRAEKRGRPVRRHVGKIPQGQERRLLRQDRHR